MTKTEIVTAYVMVFSLALAAFSFGRVYEDLRIKAERECIPAAEVDGIIQQAVTP